MATPTFLMGHIRKCTPEQFASLRYVVAGAEKLKERERKENCKVDYETAVFDITEICQAC